MNKSFKKAIALFIATIMLVSSIPFTAFAWDDDLGMEQHNFDGHLGYIFYGGSKHSDDYIDMKIMEADEDGVIVVEKGKNFSIELNMGRWQAAVGIDNARNNFGWHYGTNTDYTLNSTSHNQDIKYWYAQYNGTDIQSGVRGTMANQLNTSDGDIDLRAGAGNGGTQRDATGIFDFSTTSFPQLNTAGEYTITLYPTFTMAKWTQYMTGFFKFTNKWAAIQGHSPAIDVTIKVIEQNTYVFKDAAGTTVKTLNAWNDTDALNQKPANTASTTVKVDDTKHKVISYLWPSTSSNFVFNESSSESIVDHVWTNTGNTAGNCGVASTENYSCVCGATKTEHATAATGNHTVEYTSNGDGTHNAICTTCHEVSTQVLNQACTPGTPVEDGDEIVTSCTLCNAELSRVEKLDYDAYNDELEVVATLVASAYTTTSWQNLQDVLAQAAIDVANATTQKEIDDAVAAIRTAENDLLPAEIIYNVTVIAQDENGIVSEDTYTVPAGKEFTATTDSELSVSKWTVESNAGASKIGTVDKSVTAIINSDTTFTVYLVDENVSASTSVKVSYVGYNGNISSVQYYSSIDDVTDAEARSHVKGVAFYTFDSWNITKVSETEYVYAAEFVPASSAISANVISADPSEVLVDNLAMTNVKYDSLVAITGDPNKVVKMETSDGTIAYFKNVGFVHVPYTAQVTISLVDSAEAFTSVTGTYKDIDETGATVAAYNSAFYLPDDATFVECGAIMTVRDNIAIDLDAFKIGTAKVNKVVSSSQSAVNEYTIAFHANFGTYTKAYGRSYLTYTQDGVTKTIYSPVATINL